MKDCSDSVVHFTSQVNWTSIQEDGYVFSWNDSGRLPLNGRDKNKISAWRYFPINDPILIDAFKRSYARMKNLPGTESVVGLVICDSGIDWSEHPWESQEVLHCGITEDQLRQLGMYVKSPDNSRIAADRICKLI